MKGIGVQVIGLSGPQDGRVMRACALAEQHLASAGHEVRAREVVSTPRALARALGDCAESVSLVLLVGQTGREHASMIAHVDDLLEVRFPGYGEACRAVMTQALGRLALWDRLPAGERNGRLVLTIPADSMAQEAILKQIVLPEIQAVERRAEAAQAPPSPYGADPVLEWHQGLQHIGGRRLPPGERAEVPDVLRRVAPVMSVLNTAGQVAAAELADGRKIGLYGWPSLLQRQARVIAVGEGGPFGVIVALHRHPETTGICGEAGLGDLPARDESSVDVGARITGEPGPEGTLFAIQGEAVFVEREEAIVKWDGRRINREGTPAQALATLVLRWSQR